MNRGDNWPARVSQTHGAQVWCSPSVARDIEMLMSWRRIALCIVLPFSQHTRKVPLAETRPGAGEGFRGAERRPHQAKGRIWMRRRTWDHEAIRTVQKHREAGATKESFTSIKYKRPAISGLLQVVQ